MSDLTIHPDWNREACLGHLDDLDRVAEPSKVLDMRPGSLQAGTPDA